MTIKEFEEFYEYITRFALTEDEGEFIEDTKARYWNSLCKVPFDLAMRKAKEVYKLLLVPCNLNQLNPKVFSGENPNPGLFGRPEKGKEFYL